MDFTGFQVYLGGFWGNGEARKDGVVSNRRGIMSIGIISISLPVFRRKNFILGPKISLIGVFWRKIQVTLKHTIFWWYLNSVLGRINLIIHFFQNLQYFELKSTESNYRNLVEIYWYPTTWIFEQYQIFLPNVSIYSGESQYFHSR